MPSGVERRPTLGGQGRSCADGHIAPPDVAYEHKVMSVTTACMVKDVVIPHRCCRAPAVMLDQGFAWYSLT